MIYIPVTFFNPLSLTCSSHTLNRWGFISHCSRPALSVSCYIHICC